MLVKRSLGSVRLISIDKEELFKSLKDIARVVREDNVEVLDIRMFGSVARGEDTGKSDVDIVITISDSDKDIFHRSLKFRRYFDIEVPVDVLVYTKSELDEMIEQGNHFIEGILREGTLL